MLALKAHQIADDRRSAGRAVPRRHGRRPGPERGAVVVLPEVPRPVRGPPAATLDPDGIIERHIPTDRIVGCIAYPAAEARGPGVIRLVEGDRFPVGELDGDAIRAGRPRSPQR